MCEIQKEIIKIRMRINKRIRIQKLRGPSLLLPPIEELEQQIIELEGTKFYNELVKLNKKQMEESKNGKQ
ncbi:MAG: hypothetical protein ACRC5T_06305 [Cetobacterium sp.]